MDAAFAIAASLLAAAGFVSRDPDSRVYSEIGAQVAGHPVAEWIAPQWWGVAGANEPFREHPFGIFVLPALLARLGFPALEAGYAIGALSSILAIVLAGWLAGTVLGDRDRTAVQWALLVLPIAFVYRIRANQEYPVLALLLLAVYGTERARRSPAWSVVPSLAAVGILLIKDVFVIFAPVACALWLWCVRDGEGGGDRRAWAAVAWSLAAAAVAAVVFELVYRRAAGDSFAAFFFQHRLTPNSGLDRETGVGALVLARLSNVIWYAARLAWFAFPWSLVAVGRVKPDARADSRAAGAFRFCLLIACRLRGRDEPRAQPRGSLHLPRVPRRRRGGRRRGGAAMAAGRARGRSRGRIRPRGHGRAVAGAVRAHAGRRRAAARQNLALAARGGSASGLRDPEEATTETRRHGECQGFLGVSVSLWPGSSCLAGRVDFHHGLLAARERSITIGT